MKMEQRRKCLFYSFIISDQIKQIFILILQKKRLNSLFLEFQYFFLFKNVQYKKRNKVACLLNKTIFVQHNWTKIQESWFIWLFLLPSFFVSRVGLLGGEKCLFFSSLTIFFFFFDTTTVCCVMITITAYQMKYWRCNLAIFDTQLFQFFWCIERKLFQMNLNRHDNLFIFWHLFWFR